jgi:hypothetical protein
MTNHNQEQSFSLFNLNYAINDISIDPKVWSQQARNFFNHIHDNIPKTLDDHDFLGMGIGATSAASIAKIFNANPTVTIVSSAAGAFLGSSIASAIKNTPSHLEQKSLPPTETSIHPSGKELIEKLGFGNEIIAFLIQELEVLLYLEDRYEKPPLTVPRTFIVIIEDILRTYLIEQMNTETRQSIKPFIKGKSWQEIQNLINGNRQSLGSIARWCQVIEAHIEKHHAFQDYFTKMIGNWDIFLNDTNRLSTTLRNITPIRNALMHKPMTLQDKNPHINIMAAFGTSSITSWWTNPVNIEHPINRLLFYRYKLQSLNTSV